MGKPTKAVDPGKEQGFGGRTPMTPKKLISNIQVVQAHNQAKINISSEEQLQKLLQAQQRMQYKEQLPKANKTSSQNFYVAG